MHSLQSPFWFSATCCLQSYWLVARHNEKHNLLVSLITKNWYQSGDPWSKPFLYVLLLINVKPNPAAPHKHAGSNFISVVMKFRLFLMDGDWTFPSPLLHLRSRHPGELRQPPAAHPAQQHVSPGARQTHRGAGAVWAARTSAGLHQPASSQWNPSRTRSGGAGNELSAPP